jgi:tetratricopeptide (TPR) repeat protein
MTDTHRPNAPAGDEAPADEASADDAAPATAPAATRGHEAEPGASEAKPGASEAKAGPATADAGPATADAGPDRDRLAALVEQRDFLLRSLDDLRREHEAGDVDDTDFLALEDDYTARAARVIRAIEALETQPAGRGRPRGAASAAARRRRSRGRAAAIGAGVVAFAVLAGLLVAQASGRRQAGDTATGGIRETTQTEIDQAVGLAADGDYEAAISGLDEVLADQPDNVEALTFKGWFEFLSGDESGVVTLIDAVEADPDYPAAHAFLAVVFQRLGRPETALAELDRLDELDPPAEIANMVAGLREELEAEIAGASTTTTAQP